MDIVILRGIGVYVMAVIESSMVFVAYLIGHFVNTIPAELAIFVASLLGGLQVILILVVKRLCKISEVDFVSNKFIDEI